METPELLTAGREAFASHDWVGTVDAFASADALPPDASEALARARWWLDDPSGAIAAWEDAYTGYLREHQTRAATRAAVTIAREYTAVFGNDVAANGWLHLAVDALRDEGPCAERGWIALAEAERTHDPAVTIGHAEHALEIARAFDDAELRIRALSAIGVGPPAPRQSALTARFVD